MTCLEHYFENLLFYGADCNGDVNKNALTEAEREAVEICSYYVIYSLFNGRDEFKRFAKGELAEAVRCKDCAFYERKYCMNTGAGMEPDGFCSQGERKDDERTD